MTMPAWMADLSNAVFVFVVLLLVFVLGFAVGRWIAGRQNQILRKSLGQIEARHERETEALLDGVKVAFGDISSHSMGQISGQLLQLTQTALATDRQAQSEILDGKFGRVVGQIEKIQGIVRNLEETRSIRFGELSQQLRETGRAAHELRESTHELRSLMQNSSKRGQWGERLAEDLLKRSGFLESINYRKQMTLPGGGRPDITLMLPEDRNLHIDVKFPLENWLKAGDAIDPTQRKRHEQNFVKDLRRCLEELAERNYADKDPKSVNFSVLFLPNEPAFACALELSPELLDHALQYNVMLASPHNLIALLAIVSQSVRQFSLSSAGKELVDLLDALKSAWDGHIQELEKLDRQIDVVRRSFDRLGKGRDLDRAINDLRQLEKRV